MGGYAAFVWPAYGLSLAALSGLGYAVWRRHRMAKDALKTMPKDQVEERADG